MLLPLFLQFKYIGMKVFRHISNASIAFCYFALSYKALILLLYHLYVELNKWILCIALKFIKDLLLNYKKMRLSQNRVIHFVKASWVKLYNF